MRRRGLTRVAGRPELLWYPAKRLLHPAWRVRVHRTTPRAEFIVYVNAETCSVIQLYDNLAEFTGRGRVFMPNPMARDRRFEPLDESGDVRRPTPESYLDVPLTGLRGSHVLDGAHATTRLTSRRLKKSDHDFRVDWNRAGFEEVSAYHRVDAWTARSPTSKPSATTARGVFSIRPSRSTRGEPPRTTLGTAPANAR